MTAANEETEKKVKAMVFQWWLNSQPVETTVELFAQLHDQLYDKLGAEFEPLRREVYRVKAQAIKDHDDWAAVQDSATMMEICNGCGFEVGASDGCTTKECDGVATHGSRKVKRLHRAPN